MTRQLPIVVFSHLRWNFVYQRPQHLLSRLAEHHRVLMVEEPVFEEGAEPLIVCRATTTANLTVCEPRTNCKEPGFSEQQRNSIAPLVKKLLHEEGIDDYLLWFYSPMAFPMAATLKPRGIIYDCMDELSGFLNAPKELLSLESDLLGAADVVFTGGRSLYRAKKDRHPRVYCFPSSVDARHFGQAKQNLPEAKEQSGLPHPRLGFFGVIDERFDVAVLDEISRAKPDWQFIMVGPIVKISPDTLPHRANIHYFGQRTYDELPAFLAGWDVCLLPFARNAATRFISPTKTLEYMAAERMIVSTPITDVAEAYSDVVYLGDTPTAFLQACEQALSVSASERDTRIARMREILSGTSWESTTAAMEEILDDITDRNEVRGSKTPIERAEASVVLQTTKLLNGHANGRNGIRMGNGVPVGGDAAKRPEAAEGLLTTESQSTQRTPVVIIGAGPTGLSAAYHLGSDALLLEQNATVGGWCRSITSKGFTFDFAGHIMFSNDAYVQEMYKILLGDNVHWQNREAWIYSKQVFTRYPFQGALYGLPPEVITECIMGAVEARYGLPGPSKPESNGAAGHSCSKTNGQQNGQQNGHQNGKPALLNDCCADGILESSAKLGQNGASGEPGNFEEFIYKVWGRGIAKHFAIPYNRKLWAVPLREMETSWLGGRVPLPDLEQMVEGALQPVGKPMGPNARFGYPLRGGFQALMDGFLPHVSSQLRLETQVKTISPGRRQITLSDGSSVSYDSLISTMPLPVLIRAMGNEVPSDVRAAADGLRTVSVRCVHLGVGRGDLTDKHWIYYPEQTVFHRIFVQGNASPHCSPPGATGLTCEITYSPYKPLPCDGEDLIRRCIADCIEVGIIRKDDPILTSLQVDLPFAYVVYDHQRPKNVAIIRKWLSERGIYLAGRYSEWEYYNSDHAFLAGKKVADAVRAQTSTLSSALS